jgi:hypothetical protein
MAEPTQYALSHKELIELVIRHVGIHEGRWMLGVSFGLAPGNFGLTPDQASPGVAVVISQFTIQRAPSDAPNGLVVDAAEINPPPRRAPQRRDKESQKAPRD